MNINRCEIADQKTIRHFSIFQRNLLFFINAVTVFISSCSKGWLDVKTINTESVPESLDDYQSLLNSTIVMNTAVMPFGEISSDGHYISEAAWTSSTSPNAQNAYTWSQITPYSAFSGWNNFYARIYSANFVLEELQDFKASSIEEELRRNNIIAQALFFRASSHYWQAQLYGQPYNSATAQNDQGPPVQLTADFTKPVVRLTVQQTYDLIIDDLKSAIPYLQISSMSPTIPRLSAAYGMLARTYISMLEYDSAFIYADKCLAINSALLNFNSLSVNSNFIGRYNEEVIFHDELYTSQLSNYLTTNCLIDTVLFDSYDSNDLRKVIYFKATGRTITFKGNYNNSSTALFCGIATDEMFLMRAECYARKGNVAASMKDLNTLLKSRWRATVPYIEQSASNSEEALNKVLLERKKEFILRGLRWTDLRRLNQENRFKVTLTRKIGGKTYTLSPNSYQYTFPLMTNIIELSSLQQTTGWE